VFQFHAKGAQVLWQMWRKGVIGIRVEDVGQVVIFIERGNAEVRAGTPYYTASFWVVSNNGSSQLHLGVTCG
jgi:hypothetical protein